MTDHYHSLPPELTVETDGALRIVTLNRPEQANAANVPLHRALAGVWRLLSSDPDARVVILTGKGKAFSAGGDFEFMQRLQKDLAYRQTVMEETRQILLDMIRLPLPVIAAVNGPAVGLGCSLALSCDLVLLSETAHLADPHISVGLVPGDGGVALWPLFTSMLRAKEFLFTGERISPALAVQLGLANRIVAADKLHDEALDLARRLAQQPHQALRDTKRALNMHIEKTVAGPLEMGIQCELVSMSSVEHTAIISRIVGNSRENKHG
jgi:enoyl-CoA hydratase/carnithine racemase